MNLPSTRSRLDVLLDHRFDLLLAGGLAWQLVAGVIPLGWVRRAEACGGDRERKLAELGLSLYLAGANLMVFLGLKFAETAISMPMLKLVNNVG